eukprot:gene12368-biopygen21473
MPQKFWTTHHPSNQGTPSIIWTAPGDLSASCCIFLHLPASAATQRCSNFPSCVKNRNMQQVAVSSRKSCSTATCCKFQNSNIYVKNAIVELAATCGPDLKNAQMQEDAASSTFPKPEDAASSGSKKQEDAARCCMIGTIPSLYTPSGAVSKRLNHP